MIVKLPKNYYSKLTYKAAILKYVKSQYLYLSWMYQEDVVWINNKNRIKSYYLMGIGTDSTYKEFIDFKGKLKSSLDKKVKGNLYLDFTPISYHSHSFKVKLSNPIAYYLQTLKQYIKSYFQGKFRI